MDLYIDKIIEKVSDKDLCKTRYRIKKIKTIAGNLHAVICPVEDQYSEILVALSVINDKRNLEYYKFPRELFMLRILLYFFVLLFFSQDLIAHGPSRQKVSLKLDIKAPASEVWKIVSNFEDLLGTKK